MNMCINQNICDCINYVTIAPYFWHTMVATTMSSIFIGAILYNGDLENLFKGMIALIPYIALLVLTTTIRLSSVEIESTTMAFAGLTTIAFITFFYILGLVLGVLITKLAHRKK